MAVPASATSLRAFTVLRRPVLLFPRPSSRCLFTSLPPHRIQESSLPRIAQPSVWHLFVPKFLRPSTVKSKTTTVKSKEWNPWTVFIVLFLLIGSQSIHLLRLKQDFLAYSRRADAKIALLKEVIERVQRGEKVDVERILGTGDAHEEKEWEEVLKELEGEDKLWSARARKRKAQEVAVKDPEAKVTSAGAEKDTSRTTEPVAPKGFY